MGKGRLFIISGPSGSGKDTILKQIFKLLPDIRFSISTITRPMRAGEIEGEKYNFTTKEAFEKMIDNDELLEYNVYLDNYYGTPEAPVLTLTTMSAWYLGSENSRPELDRAMRKKTVTTPAIARYRYGELPEVITLNIPQSVVEQFHKIEELRRP